MALKRSLDAYLERTKVVVSLGPDDEMLDVVNADHRLIADLERASLSYRVWTWATAFVALTLAFVGLLTQGKRSAASSAPAAWLFSCSRSAVTGSPLILPSPCSRRRPAPGSGGASFPSSARSSKLWTGLTTATPRGAALLLT